MPFPQDRYLRAGASPEKLSELEAAYETLSPEAQESYDARLAPLSDYEIAERLLSEPVQEVDEAPEPTVSAPQASSSSASSTQSSGPGSDSGK